MSKLFFIITTLYITLSGCGQVSFNNHTENKTDTLFPQIKIVSDTEPGEPLHISGTIFLPDGKTPAKDAILSIWQTDAKGNYNEGGGGAGEEHPRLHGRMKTGTDGKYEFYTIKPAPYPSNTTPAHIHAHISAPGFPEYALIYYFEGDKLITENNRAAFNLYRGGTPSIITLSTDSGKITIGHRDIILEYVKPSNETMKLKW